MTNENDEGSGDEKGPAPEPSDAAPDTRTPGDEIKAAFGHLKSAAGLFFDRISHDAALKKAAEEAESAVTRAASGAERALGAVAGETEKALKKLGERAEPMAKTVAKEIGDELGRVAKSVSSVFEPDPIPKEGGAAAAEEADASPASAEPAAGPQADDEEAKKSD